MLEAKGEWALFTRRRSLGAHRRTGEALGGRTNASQAQVAIGSRALDRSLIGVHQPFFRENVGPRFQPA